MKKEIKESVTVFINLFIDKDLTDEQKKIIHEIIRQINGSQ
jgi:hypothetical protein